LSSRSTSTLPEVPYLTGERIARIELLKVGKKLPLTLKQFGGLAAKLATRADSDRSWTVDLAARRAKAGTEALPFREFARGKAREADPHRIN
jgi:hypothetical protein